MTPGTDADVRRRRRTRNRFLGACLVVAAMTGTVVTGAFTDGLSGGVAGAAPAIALFLCAAAVLAAQALHWHRFAVTRVRELAVAAATGRPAALPKRWVPPGPGDLVRTHTWPGCAARLGERQPSRWRVPGCWSSR
ncbi:hypothetical protein ACFWQL_32965 [Amycolatopsis thermoflava]|uniref:hypothetical protein n=1 Tax=Amycolatopsis thermoflava TaxID=84480 RepID=UPI0036593C03